MNEYLELGHIMSKIENAESNVSSQSSYYMPHHAVLRESSTTSRIRVVFDAAAKTSTGTSLNDQLLVGPTIQNDLFTIALRFRIHRYVLTADIEKMYRQVNVNLEDTNYQRILWRSNESEPITSYKLNTVTYGTASAPFLAIREPAKSRFWFRFW